MGWIFYMTSLFVTQIYVTVCKLYLNLLQNFVCDTNVANNYLNVFSGVGNCKKTVARLSSFGAWLINVALRPHSRFTFPFSILCGALFMQFCVSHIRQPFHFNELPYAWFPWLRSSRTTFWPWDRRVFYTSVLTWFSCNNHGKFTPHLGCQ